MTLAPRQSIPLDLATNFITAANWIWTPEDTPNLALFPSGNRTFRRWYNSTRNVFLATILITADDSFTLYVNGKEVGIGTHRRAHIFRAHLEPENNLFAAICTNSNGGHPVGFAGLLAAVQLEYLDGGNPEFLISNTSWRGMKTDASSGYASPSLDDTTWEPAIHLGFYSTSPWNGTVVLPGETAPRVVTSIPPFSSASTSATAVYVYPFNNYSLSTFLFPFSFLLSPFSSHIALAIFSF